ncbi:MAG: hypothetical protein IIA10_00590 [Proteobacteria bacterium]|nr:hypothetical protein [Pseudomonadota bacterium]MCH7833942.1 hypothetical protein [Pseudomonadota bacterium]
MKYLIMVIIGFFVGAATTIVLMFFNPLASANPLSPLAVSDNELISLNYSAVAGDAIVFTNNGNSQVRPKPAKVLQLWEASIRHTEVLVTVLTNSRNAVVGLGVKITSDSESTRLIKAEMLVDSIWHIYLPGRGSLFIEQTENFWSYAREVIAPAYWSSADNWKGVWNGNTTAGPGALGTARVIGGSGEFSNRQMAAVEALSARVYSVESGPLAMDGHLTIELRSEDGALASEFAAE